MNLEGINRQFITERDVLEEMDDGNDAQVLRNDNTFHSMRDMELLQQTSGWQEHVKLVKRESDAKWAETVKRMERARRVEVTR